MDIPRHQWCSGAGTRRNVVPVTKMKAERRSSNRQPHHVRNTDAVEFQQQSNSDQSGVENAIIVPHHCNIDTIQISEESLYAQTGRQKNFGGQASPGPAGKAPKR